jgi:hypothetical protein
VYDFKGRPLLSKPLNPNSPTAVRWGGATHVLAVIALDRNGLPIEFSSGGGGSGDMTKALIIKWPYPEVSDTWIIRHNMNCYPSVRVEDSEGVQGIPDVDYISKNEINVLLTRETSGIAYLSRYPNTTLTDEAGTEQPVELIFGNPDNLVVECPIEIPPVTDPTIHQTDFIDKP